jgi:hypothetical protein
MLQYRLFVEIDDDRRAVEKKATEQLHSWLREKQLNADALEPGPEVVLGANAVGSIAASDRQDGSRSLRAVIVEDNQKGRWTTQLTVDVPGTDKRKPWVWLDLDGPENTRGSVPRLARSLLEVFEGKTDDIRQGAAQPVTDTDEVGALVDAVCDPDRRGLVFVAGSDSRLPFDQWLRLVRVLLRDCVGLSGGYILDPQATEMFNNAIGPQHRVEPWTLRTFRPGVEPDDPADGRRHKVLGHDRISTDPTSRIARMLGWRAREAALGTPLPVAAQRINRIFDQVFDQKLLDTLDRPAAISPPPLAAPVPSSITITPVLTALGHILGGGPVTAERVLALGELVDLGRGAREGRAAIGKRLVEYEDALAMVRGQHQEVRAKLEDAQLEYAIADEERAAAEAEVRRLQKLLVTSDQADRVWAPDDEESTDHRPADCDELAGLLDSWDHVCFTGDDGPLRDLDQQDETGAWAGKIWEALAVLDDYARVTRSGSFAGDVHHYLGNTPAGCRTFPQQKHAQDEREQVRTNPRYYTARVLPVPSEVDPSGRVFMGAHFKIAKYRMISPRLHYYNDVHRSGLVYVGYMGKHLPNPQTN